MGCTLATDLKKNVHKTHVNRRGKMIAIDTRKKSARVIDEINQNVTLTRSIISNDQINFALASLENLTLFSSLTTDELQIITRLLIPAFISKGQYVFRQQDEGNCFFLIENGQVYVQIDQKTIKTLSKGQTFGQIALILRTKRSASIKAKTDCNFLIMKPLIFRQTIQKLKTNEYEMKRNSIQKVKIFQGLTNKQKLSLANALKIMIYQKDEKIITINQEANAFYIINQGKVAVQIPNYERVVLGKNQSFGENAFKTNGRRKATVVALERTVCSIISKEYFEKHSGIKAEKIYFYNLKKWALRKSNIFKKYDQNLLNAINLAFEVQYAERNTRIRNTGLVICLQGRINQFNEGEHIFGQNEWKQGKKSIGFDLIQQESGYYAYLNYKNLNTLLENIQKRRSSRSFAQSIFRSNKQNYGSLDLQNFEYLKDLGQGQFGTVKLVRDPTMQTLYALKQISKSSIQRENLSVYIEEERRILQKIQFPFIVGFVKAFSDDKNVYFLMEYLKGVQLFNVIRELPCLNKEMARYFFASIMLSIQHLHSNGIIYRDIKPENSVVDNTGKVYLIDMGTAKFLKKQKSFRTFTIIGTPHYMSPEIFSGQGYSFESDIWSLGVLMYEFICNKLPFGEDEHDIYKVMQKIKKDQVKYPTQIESEAEELLKMMLNRNPKQRVIEATFEKIKSAQYFRGFSWSDMLEEKLPPPYIPKQFRKSGGLKTINMQGKPLTKVLYPEEYKDKIPINFKEWNDSISF